MVESLVSIIIPCKEVLDFQKESVNGCLNLDWSNFEIILLPDSSFKNSLWSPKVRIIPTGSILPAEKRNIGIKNAKGKFIAFIDSDAFPLKNWLSEAIAIFSDSKVGVVGGPSLVPPDEDFRRKTSNAILSSKIGGGGLSDRYSEGQMKNADDIPSSNMIVRKETIQKLGGFNANYWPGEDTYFCMQIKKILKKEIIYSPKVSVYHHPRQIFKPHLKQIWSYGLHRGYFAKKFPDNSRHFTYWVPSIFLIFNALGITLSILFPNFFFIPYVGIMSFYFIICIVTGIQTKNLKILVFVSVGIPLTHIVYGCGFIKGILSNLKH